MIEINGKKLSENTLKNLDDPFKSFHLLNLSEEEDKILNCLGGGKYAFPFITDEIFDTEDTRKYHKYHIQADYLNNKVEITTNQYFAKKMTFHIKTLREFLIILDSLDLNHNWN